MKINMLVDEDFVNYREPTMTIGFPYCTFKCGKENCQNASLEFSHTIECSYEELVDRFLGNPITKAVCFQGLEPFDSGEDLFGLIEAFRKKTDCEIVIYSGYNLPEVYRNGWFDRLKQYGNIILKVGRFIPDSRPRFDSMLGVTLASSNQYAVGVCENAVLKDDLG